MIISRTPYRISFFGGGTDYPDWYLTEGGAVLSTTIDKYCYLMCRFLPPFFDIRHRITWSHIEGVSSISEILHPAVREGLRYLGFDDSFGMEIHHQGDLPARSGIGSSSSFSVGLINALLTLKKQSVLPHELALKAIELEQSVLKENVGSQDQMAAAHGGLNVIRFATTGNISVEPIASSESRLRELESHLMLLHLGTSRLASEVASSIIANLHNRAGSLQRMHTMVDEALSILAGNGDLNEFGELLHEGWILKRALADVVSTPNIDQTYATARAHGAVGGKLLGAGGAGFFLFFVPPDRQEGVQKALPHHSWVPFAFENTGSTIIYADHDKQPINAYTLDNNAYA